MQPKCRSHTATVGDFAEGRGGRSSLADYSLAYDNADRDMGRGIYAEKESGDYWVFDAATVHE